VCFCNNFNECVSRPCRSCRLLFFRVIYFYHIFPWRINIKPNYWRHWYWPTSFESTEKNAYPVVEVPPSTANCFRSCPSRWPIKQTCILYFNIFSGRIFSTRGSSEFDMMTRCLNPAPCAFSIFVCKSQPDSVARTTQRLLLMGNDVASTNCSQASGGSESFKCP